MQAALGVGLRSPNVVDLTPFSRRRTRAQSRAAGRQLAVPTASGRSAPGDKSPKRDVSLGAIAQPPPPALSSSSPAAGSLPLCIPEDLQVAPGEVVPVLGPKIEELDLYPYLRRILTAKVYDLAVRCATRSLSTRRIDPIRVIQLEGLFLHFSGGAAFRRDVEFRFLCEREPDLNCPMATEKLSSCRLRSG